MPVSKKSPSRSKPKSASPPARRVLYLDKLPVGDERDDWDTFDEIVVKLPPDCRNSVTDRIWFEEQYNRCELGQYRGNFVAIYNAKIYGHGPHNGELRDRVCKEFNINPHRLVVMYVEPSPFEPEDAPVGENQTDGPR